MCLGALGKRRDRLGQLAVGSQGQSEGKLSTGSLCPQEARRRGCPWGVGGGEGGRQLACGFHPQHRLCSGMFCLPGPPPQGAPQGPTPGPGSLPGAAPGHTFAPPVPNRPLDKSPCLCLQFNVSKTPERRSCACLNHYCILSASHGAGT